MAIKRYNLKELRDICRNLFFDYMADSSVYYEQGTIKECNPSVPTPAHALHQAYMEMIEENRERARDYANSLSTVDDGQVACLINEQIAFLENEYNILSSLNIETQKKIYKNSNSLEYSRSSVTFPLNKLINSFYDDLFLEVLFYDDTCTPNGLFGEFIKLRTASERKEFLRKHIIITHMGLALLDSQKNPISITVIEGDSSDEVEGGNILILPPKYGDFANLKLADTMSITNNDIKQFLQTKVDMDKEDMTFLAEEQIRGDNYKLYKYEHYDINRFSSKKEKRTDFYIRYVCASTGRVYYNNLVLNNLALSSYFNQKDYPSYLKAWWSITHLGASVDGNPVISC